MSYLAKMFNNTKTSQTVPLLGAAQVANSAGGFVFNVDLWAALDRFLILGTQGGTYYAAERSLTLQNCERVLDCLEADGLRAVKRIVEISREGRAPKNEPALFALALAAKLGNQATRTAAFAALPEVARIGTHLFTFAEHIKVLGGWGRGTTRAFARWYTDMEPKRLAFQAVKYQARVGWSHRDLLRKAHPKAQNDQQQALFHWITKGWESVGESAHPDKALATVWAFERAKGLRGERDVNLLCDLIRQYKLPHECVPSEMKQHAQVWEALLCDMGLTAMLRNLAKMTQVGLLTEFSSAQDIIVSRLNSAEELQAARVHPLQILVAANTYARGQGEKGKLKWTPRGRIVDALNQAFYLAFKTIKPTQARTLLALDVSGSMDSGQLAGMPGISPRVGSAAMALITAAVEPKHEFVAFTNGTYKSIHSGFGSGITPLSISAKWPLQKVVEATNGLDFGGTDCALPMLWAAKNKVPVDLFCVYTDSETWAGDVHPVQALKAYRQEMGIAAKLAVIGMVSNGFTIADPNDTGMLDVVGFDTATPAVLADFASRSLSRE